jgi:mannose-6-phosphate isomerase-like protein (cupin superfamily)
MLIKRLGECRQIVAGDGTLLRELLHPARDEAVIRYSLAVAQVRPGSRSRPHRLKTSEVYYIIRGLGVMHIGDEQARVSAGDAIYIPPDSPQWIENSGANDLEFACIVDPAWRREDEEVLP